ncbi:MAG: hypothetical protein HOP33_04825 [Verrucomicrobia bacterium]|nr:hypothetical protein [Verrucomicrobiota bacterium]
MKKTTGSKTGFVLGAVLLGALTGCVGYVDRPHHVRAYAPPPPDYVESGVVVLQDDYVYYPGYQIYYSSNRRQYVYLQGRSWVSRPAPPRVSVEVLFASPSVRLDFHDAPSIHHASVVRQYPKYWSPPGANSNHGQDKKNQDNGNGHGNRKHE